MNPISSIVNYPSPDCCETSKQAESPNLLETFKRKKARLELQMADVNNVIAALEKSPELNTLFELIAKAR